MNTELPSGVWMTPVFATRLNVRVLPTSVPFRHTIPSFGATVARALAAPWSSSSEPAARARQRTSLCAVPVTESRLDMRLAHLRVRRQRAVLVDAHLGHHSAE